MNGQIKKYIAYIVCVCVAFLLLLPLAAQAVTWEFGTYGEGKNPFRPRGYVIITDDGKFWLNSRFDNSDGNVTYTSIFNGVYYVDAKKMDGSNYTLYAFTDRGVRVYRYLVAYKNGVPIENFNDYIGAPGRIEDPSDKLGSGANWAIPITGLEFEAGCLYEFAFLRGMQANNGITLIFSEDGQGYIQNPSTQEEIAKYEAEKYEEYEFISSYWTTEKANGELSYDFHLVPMRFSLQTYADLSTWKTVADEAAEFLKSVTPSDISTGKYKQGNVDNLALLLAEQGNKAEQVVRKQLQPAAEVSMLAMLEELNPAFLQAQSSLDFKSDISVLEELLRDANVLYEKASANMGKDIGQYSEERTRILKENIDEASLLTDASPQALINNAIKNVSEAQVRLLNSVVRKKRIILSDPVSGVKVVAEVGSIPDDTVLYVDTIVQNISAAGGIKEFFGNAVTAMKFYDIKLYSGDIIISPTVEVEVQLPVPDDMRGMILGVYQAGELPPPRLGSLGAGNYRVFHTESLGVFVMTAIVAGAAQEPESPEGIPVDNPTEESHETAPITIIEETEVELNENPDQNKEELEETNDANEIVETINQGQAIIDHELLAVIDMPVAGLRRPAEPLSVLLVILALAVFALLLSVVDVIKKKDIGEPK